MGDGNRFAQTNFKQDRHSDFRSCILIDLLERFLNQLNETRDPLTRITLSNTQAGEYIRSLQGATNASCDCLLTISLWYGKQTVVAEDRATRQSDNTDESAFSVEILLSDIEQPKHLWYTTWVSRTQTVIFTLRSCVSLL